jgi:hypothetical protein
VRVALAELSTHHAIWLQDELQESHGAHDPHARIMDCRNATDASAEVQLKDSPTTTILAVVMLGAPRPASAYQALPYWHFPALASQLEVPPIGPMRAGSLHG